MTLKFGIQIILASSSQKSTLFLIEFQDFKILYNKHSNFLIELELKIELEAILNKEEFFWYQKFRRYWIAFGDENTKFFHTSTIIRQKKNKIETFKNDCGEWISNNKELKMLACHFSKKFYTKERVSIPYHNTTTFPSVQKF